jgi:hypothetical protein
MISGGYRKQMDGFNRLADEPLFRSTKEQPASHLAGHPGRLMMAVGSGLTASSSS